MDIYADCRTFCLFGGVFNIAVKNNAKEMTINDEIDSLHGFGPSKMVRVIGPESEQLGMMQLSAAQNNAYDRGLDIVLIAPQADPPVCKIMDYGKFRFERDKREKEAKKKQQVVEIKEIQLSCHIDVNDFNTKVNHAKRFLSDGNKVRVLVKFKGRQMTHQEIGRELISRFEEACAEMGAPEKAPILEGRNLVMFIAPLKPGKDKPAKAEAKPAEEPESGENG